VLGATAEKKEQQLTSDSKQAGNQAAEEKSSHYFISCKTPTTIIGVAAFLRIDVCVSIGMFL
jgi:hypothetical protein